ncbi:gamma-glutamyl-gamma-aminobutyrate hydrolase family protein [Enterococcus faecalis]
MSKPVIGIAGNQLLEATAVFYGNQVTYAPQGFVNAIQLAGGVPLVFPVGTPDLAKVYIQQVDKLLLAGGQDVTPAFYGEEPHLKLGETNRDRDEFELALIQEALLQKKPIFAVCRGMQLLNVALGGTLYQDLSLYPDWQLKHNQQPTKPQFATHTIQLANASLLYRIFGAKATVNSYHHQAVNQLSQQLQATAWSTDGIIEAVEAVDASQRLLGVQWHPELTYLTDSGEEALFDYFVHQL